MIDIQQHVSHNMNIFLKSMIEDDIILSSISAHKHATKINIPELWCYRSFAITNVARICHKFELIIFIQFVITSSRGKNSVISNWQNE